MANDSAKYDIVCGWKNAFSALDTGNALADSPTASTPVGGTGGVVDLSLGNTIRAPRFIVFRVYGTGADNATVQVKFDGLLAGPGGVYAAEPLVQVTATLSTVTGPSTTSVPSTSHRYADTMAVDTGFGGSESALVKSPADNLGIAHVCVDVRGYPQGKFVVDLGSATAAQVEYRVLP